VGHYPLHANPCPLAVPGHLSTSAVEITSKHNLRTNQHSLVTRLRARRHLRFQAGAEKEFFLLATFSRLAVRATQPPLQWVRGGFFSGG